MALHRSFLVLGGSGFDILSLIKGGLEISNFNYVFKQGVDRKGKATTKVFGGTMSITLSQVPTTDITEWALNSRKYMDGIIVSVNNENIPVNKVIFQNAICSNFEINYTQTGKTYTSTKLTIEAEKLIVGDGITFENEWTKD